ncbi:MAG: hypothetical protein FJ387_04210 [Verrucomicrobia bacterium]|nr:hypothetical protein [Verrucomicrobiota bacterium]
MTVEDGNLPPLANLLAPGSRAEFTAPATVGLTAEASDPDGEIAQVAFYVDDGLLATVTSPPWTAVWSNAPPGAVLLRAAATDRQGKSTFSMPTPVQVLQRPANDLFVNRSKLSGISATDSGTTLNATVEPGEPPVAGSSVASIWWEWTAPTDGRLRIQPGPYDRFALYVGDEVNALQAVPPRDQNPLGPPEPTDYLVQAGRTYRLAGDDNGETRVLRLTLHLTPANGRFLLPALLPQDALRLTLLAYTGSRLVIESSTDLVHWSPLSTNVAVEGAVVLDLARTSNVPYRFYRGSRP